MTAPMVAALALLCLAASEPPRCAERSAMAAQLDRLYGERLAEVSDPWETAAELYWNPHTGTWTITIAPPGHFACIRAVGRERPVWEA